MRLFLTLRPQRWLAAECMGGCIPHAALELLCVSVCSSGCRFVTFCRGAFLCFFFKTTLRRLQTAADSLGRIHALARPHGAHGLCSAGDDATHVVPCVSILRSWHRFSRSTQHRSGPRPPLHHLLRSQLCRLQQQPLLPLPSNILMRVL